MVPNSSVHGKYNLISIWFDKISLCVTSVLKRKLFAFDRSSWILSEIEFRRTETALCSSENWKISKSFNCYVIFPKKNVWCDFVPKKFLWCNFVPKQLWCDQKKIVMWFCPKKYQLVPDITVNLTFHPVLTVPEACAFLHNGGSIKGPPLRPSVVVPLYVLPPSVP